MRQAQPMGQRMDQARARFRRAEEAMLKAQANFEQAQQEVIKAQADLHKLMQEAPLPFLPAPHVNMNLVKPPEAPTGPTENTRKQEAGPPPDELIRAIQESRAPLQAPPAILAQEGGAALPAETDAEQDPELWD